MNNENEKILVEKFLNFNDDILAVQQYIKENYHVSSEYDENEDII